MISHNYSDAAMLGGILLISLDKIFGKTWLVNRAAERSSKSKSQTMRKWWRMIFHYGIVDDYLGLIGTGIIIAVIITEISRAVIMGDTLILATHWDGFTNAIPTGRFLFVVPTIVGAFLAGVIGIFVVIFTKWLDERSAKNFTHSVLKLEIDANQSQLRSHLKNGKKILNLKEEYPNFVIVDLEFDRTMYSALADKIGLLDPKIGETVVLYYTKIKLVEAEVRESNKDYQSVYDKHVIKRMSLLALKRSIENAEEADETYKRLMKEPKW